MQPAVLTALVASATSIIVAVTSAVLAYGTQRRTADANAQYADELARLQNRLSDLSAVRKARLDYEYEAQKHLYAVTEPLLFQLSERAEDLQARISRLAKAARSGDLEPDQGWLSYDGYFLRSTVHRLMAPVALFHLLQDGLTQVDLNLDPSIRAQYLIFKYLAYALTDHYIFAAYEPSLSYNPGIGQESSDEDVRFQRLPSGFQGLPSGIVETAGQSLIIQTTGGTARVMRFGEFDDAYSDRKSTLYRACAPVAELLHNFHPRTYPVLWRILITQASLCTACTAFRDRAGTGEEPDNLKIRARISVSSERRNDYDWRQHNDTTEDSLVLVEPFEVARQYLEVRVATPIEMGATASALTDRASDHAAGPSTASPHGRASSHDSRD